VDSELIQSADNFFQDIYVLQQVRASSVNLFVDLIGFACTVHCGFFSRLLAPILYNSSGIVASFIDKPTSAERGLSGGVVA
jgi:hypothetical protein